MGIETCLDKMTKFIDGFDYRHLEFEIIITMLTIRSIVVKDIS